MDIFSIYFYEKQSIQIRNVHLADSLVCSLCTPSADNRGQQAALNFLFINSRKNRSSILNSLQVESCTLPTCQYSLDVCFKLMSFIYVMLEEDFSTGFSNFCPLYTFSSQNQYVIMQLFVAGNALSDAGSSVTK